MKKGISPLVAAVLLIAATMSIATILTFWASTFIKSSLPPSANETYGECLAADFNIYSCSSSGTTTGNITLILHNRMGIELRNISVYLFYPNNVINSYSTEIIPDNILPGGGKYWYKSFAINDVTLPFNKIKVTTHCPTVEKESTCR